MAKIIAEKYFFLRRVYKHIIEISVKLKFFLTPQNQKYAPYAIWLSIWIPRTDA